jgi:sugar lactone lactonase YvrE
LYWTDIPAGRIDRYAPQSGACGQIYEGAAVGESRIQADNTLLLFRAGGAIAQWKDGQLHTRIDGIPDEADMRFNDVIADPRAECFAGPCLPKNDPAGWIVSILTQPHIVAEWNAVQQWPGILCRSPAPLKYTDSYARVTCRFDYSEQTNQEVAIPGVAVDRYPDGLTPDAEGYLWSARRGGGCLIRYSPEGVEEGRVKLSVKLVTSIAFGGPHPADIFVTTARDAEIRSVSCFPLIRCQQ